MEGLKSIWVPKKHVIFAWFFTAYKEYENLKNKSNKTHNFKQKKRCASAHHFLFYTFAETFLGFFSVDS